MANQRLQSLFATQQPIIREIINSVLLLEQQFISMERPRVKEDIDNIIAYAANKELDKPAEQGSADEN